MAEVIERHYHWVFMAFDEANRAKDNPTQINHAVEVSVIGYRDEATALTAAMDLIARDVYKLQRVWECSTCGFQKEMGKAMTKFAAAAQGEVSRG